MKSDDARTMMDAARTKAKEIGKPVSVAILDSGGLMVMFERVGDPPPSTSVVAEGKASASAFTGRDSANLSQGSPAIQNAMFARLNGRFIPHQGALAVRVAGELIGAIGVSGATSEEDEAIARAGLEALTS
jgi:uncharacterized protein GlcG (DUF336 family)